ncbi:MAG: response regulator transcription factor [Bacteroidota bacterium]
MRSLPPLIMLAIPEETIRVMLADELIQTGYRLLEAENSTQILSLAEQFPPDLIILAFQQDKEDGLSVYHSIKNLPEFKGIPIGMLASKEDNFIEGLALDAGVDFFILDPIDIPQFKQIVKEALSVKIREKIPPNRLLILPDEYVVNQGPQNSALTRREFELVNFMSHHPGKIFRRAELLAQVWKNEPVTGRTIDVHINRLREKIGSHHFKTVKGVGYGFLPKNPD